MKWIRMFMLLALLGAATRSCEPVWAAQAPLVVPNGTGAQFRTNTNNALGALASHNSGASAPSPTYAYMSWVDTSTSPPTIRIMNGANNAWIAIGTVNDTGAAFLAVNAALINGFAASQSPGANQAVVLDSSGHYPANATFPNGITVPTQSGTDNSTKAASTAQVQAAVALLGIWTARTYNSTYYRAPSPLTWTVESGDVWSDDYYVIGKTLHWTLSIAASTLSGTMGPALYVAMPTGAAAKSLWIGNFLYDNNGTGGVGVISASAGSNTLTLYKSIAEPNWTASSNLFTVTFSLDIELQ